MCYYESESKICSRTISTVNGLHICWNLDVSFTLCLACSHGGIQAQFPFIFVPRKVCFLPPNSLFCSPNPETWLQTSLHFQTCGILTSESANVSDFSPHIIFAVS